MHVKTTQFQYSLAYLLNFKLLLIKEYTYIKNIAQDNLNEYLNYGFTKPKKLEEVLCLDHEIWG